LHCCQAGAEASCSIRWTIVVDLCEERTDHVLDLVETLGAEGNGRQW
jgi:hypothetical protein